VALYVTKANLVVNHIKCHFHPNKSYSHWINNKIPACPECAEKAKEDKEFISEIIEKCKKLPIYNAGKNPKPKEDNK